MMLGTCVQRDGETIRRTAEEVLARPEFRARAKSEPSWLMEALDDFFEWLGDLFGIGGAGSAGDVLVFVLWTVIGLLLVWIVWLFARRALGRRGRAVVVDPASVRAERVKDLLERARAARARGELADALRFTFWALVVGLSERGDLEYRDAWTNRELVERGKPRPDVARVLAPLVPDLDAKSFGHVPALASDVDRLEALCREHLGGLAR